MQTPFQKHEFIILFNSNYFSTFTHLMINVFAHRDTNINADACLRLVRYL